MPSLISILTPFLLASAVAGGPLLIEREDTTKCRAEQVRTVTVSTTVTVTAPRVATTAHYAPQSPTVVITEPSAVPPKPLPLPDVGNQQRPGRRNAVYFTNWGIYGANFQPQQLPASEITHLLYAFADIAQDGTVKSSDTYADIEKHYPTDSWNDVGTNAYGCVKQLFLLKKQNRGMKILLSIGGWTYSPKFVPVAADPAKRQRFVSSAIQMMADYGFDGLDIDWEYPQNDGEADNFVSLLQETRTALDNYASQHAPGYHFYLSVASPAGAQNYNKMRMAGMDKYLDSWHLMAYDYAGSWDQTSGHQSNIFSNPNDQGSTKFSTEQAVSDYISLGISPYKINLGLPLYGRSFMQTEGIGKPYSGLGQGSIEQGVWLYKDLPRPGATEHWDGTARASYSYDPATKELVTYDTVQSAREKVAYLLGKGLGGAVFWEASGDRTGEQSLIGVLAKGVGSLDATPNLLSYPGSKYDNIRAGMP